MEFFEIDDLMSVPRGAPEQLATIWPSKMAQVIHTHRPNHNLYHYTSYKSAIEIVKSGQLFLFDPLTSNDEEELYNAKGFVLEAVKMVVPAIGRASRERANFIGKIEDFLKSHSSDYFILCLTEGAKFEGAAGLHPADQLQAWRSYGADGEGVALGFSYDHLADELARLGRRSLLAPVVYNDDEKIRRITYLLEEAMKIKRDNKISYDAILHMVCYALTQIIPLFKHIAFKEEKEWRASYLATFDERFKVKNAVFGGIAKNYRSLTYKCEDATGFYTPISLREIVIGPARDRKLLAQSISQTTKAEKISVPVHASSIPYRGAKSP